MGFISKEVTCSPTLKKKKESSNSPEKLDIADLVDFARKRLGDSEDRSKEKIARTKIERERLRL